MAEIVDPATVVPGPMPGQLVVSSFSFSGPLPHPAILAQYNDALPDGAERVMAMAEQQSRHRRQMESRGQLMGFAIAMVVLVGGIVLIALGKSTEGLVPLISGLVGLAGLFVYGQVQGRNAAKQLERAVDAQNNEGHGQQ